MPMGIYKRRSLEERFWLKVVKTDDGCWGWNKGKHIFGYGIISVNGKSMTAHRFSWLLHNGEIPNGLFVCHKCDNPPCCNPEHLFLGTHKENMQDCVAKGRIATGTACGNSKYPEKRPKGEANGRSKLTDKEVLEIRQLRKDGRGRLEIANKFGVTVDSITKICSNKIWKHIK